MTLQIHAPTAAISSAAEFEDQPFGLLLGGWTAAREISAYWRADSDTPSAPVVANPAPAETNIFGPQVGLRNKISAYAARRHLNRSFRRNQREFDNVMDAVAHDPAGQLELRTIWTIGRQTH